MKSSQDIISLIKKKPYFKQLGIYDELNKLKIFLPLDMRKAILYITHKNDRLLFAFNHPSFLNEFNYYKSKLIKESLKTHQDIFPHLQNITEIRGFNPKNILYFYHQPLMPLENPYYYEHSKGEFNNLATNKALKEKFEAIREAILKNLAKQSQ